MCGCNNGRLTCTDIEECRDKNDERDENERRCEKCQQVPPMLVCGRDGRTHHSRCIAMNCSGLGENDVLDGPCSNQVYIAIHSYSISIMIVYTLQMYNTVHIHVHVSKIAACVQPLPLPRWTCMHSPWRALMSKK